MPKSWQEIEFLDYKERQIRRRSQRTRELEQVGTSKTSDRSRLLRLSVGGLTFLALLSAGIFAYQNYGAAGLMSAAYRSTLGVASVSGEVEMSTTTSNWEPLKAGARLRSGIHVRTGKSGKVTLSPAIPGSRIVLYENTGLFFEKIQLSAKNPQSAAMTFEMEKGEAVFDFTAGTPLTKLVLPLVTVWSQLGRYKAQIGKEENRVLVARIAVKAEDRADSSRKAVVTADQEIVATLKSPLGKARNALGAALKERWD